MRLTHQGISELWGKKQGREIYKYKYKYLPLNQWGCTNPETYHIVWYAFVLLCMTSSSNKSTFLRPSKSDYRQHLFPPEESRWRCGCTAPGTEKDDVIRDLTKANYRLGPYLTIISTWSTSTKITDIILTNKSKQYKELKIFQGLCSEKNQ